MRILFLTLSRTVDISSRGIYSDLIRKFRDEGNEVCVVSPLERRFGKRTYLEVSGDISLLRVRTLNILQTNILEKGLANLLIDRQYLRAIERYLSGVRFDLVLYSTPPVTFAKVVNAIKCRDGARSYLLLKDIFPQNAVDLDILRRSGFLHRMFREKEKRTYAVADAIGCMSPANVRYILAHNPALDPRTVHVNPNSIAPSTMRLSLDERRSVRTRHGIPSEMTVFIYGGNLGRPQGIDFMLDVLECNSQRGDAFFVVVGTGTEFSKVQAWFNQHRPTNALLLKGLPKEGYDQLVQSSDVGLVFLDGRFTIPNFPSRLLSYLECRLPVIAATDPNTDLGVIMEEGGFGFWSRSGDLNGINRHIEALCRDVRLRHSMGDRGLLYLLKNYHVDVSYNAVMEALSRQSRP
jgi:glycosyltransferase involved in cell wall biosynthesis